MGNLPVGKEARLAYSDFVWARRVEGLAPEPWLGWNYAKPSIGRLRRDKFPVAGENDFRGIAGFQCHTGRIVQDG